MNHPALLSRCGWILGAAAVRPAALAEHPDQRDPPHAHDTGR